MASILSRFCDYLFEQLEFSDFVADGDGAA
jgi:hypothetical protein